MPRGALIIAVMAGFLTCSTIVTNLPITLFAEMRNSGVK